MSALRICGPSDENNRNRGRGGAKIALFFLSSEILLKVDGLKAKTTL